MSDDLRMKIAELEKKLGDPKPGELADAFIKEGAPTPAADEMIDRMIKKMRGEIEPAKVVKEEKPARLMPTEHVTFPQFIGALTAEMGAGFMKGLLHPVSSFTNNIGLKFTPGDVERQKVIRNYMRRGDFPIKSSLGLEAIAEKAPGAVGEVAGTIATFIPVYRGTSIAVRGAGTAIKAFDRATQAFVPMSKAATETARIAATNLGSTTLFEAAAELDDGESKLARVAMDTALGIALEGAGPISRLLRAGLQEELGEAGFKALAGQVGEQTLIRTRAGVATPEEAEQVLKAAAKTERKLTSKKARRREERKASQESNVRATKKRVADTPVVAQARKIQEAAFEKLLPPPNGMILDPGLALAVAKGERPGVHYKVSVDGQIIEGVFHTSSREYPNRFAQNVIDVRNRIIALQKEGKDARLIEVRFGSPGSRSRFENLWLGKVSENRVHGRPAPKIPHSVTDNKSAAVRGVQVGQKVKVKRPDGKTVDAEVIKTDFVPIGKNPYAGSGFDPSLPVQKDGTPTASIMREKVPQKRSYSERYSAEGAKARLERMQQLREKIKQLPKDEEHAERLLRTWYNEAVTDEERKLIEDALQPFKSQQWREWLHGVQEKGKAAEEAARAERNALREKLGSSAVTVKYPDGKIEVLDLKEIEVAVPRMREPLELQQHVSGAEQRLYIDTVNRKVEWEGIASNLDPESNFFRSGFFEEVDPTIDYHDHVRGAYKDGVLTLSAPAAYEEMIPTQTGPMIRQSIPDEGANVSMHYRDTRPGPYLGGVPRGTDIAETIMGRAAPEYATTYRHGYAQEDKSKPIRDAARMNVEPQEGAGRPWRSTVELQADGTYMALGIPRPRQGHVPAGWEPPGLDEARTLRRSKLIAERDDSLDDVEGVLDDLDDFDAVSDDETADEIFSANTRRRLAQRGVDPLELRYEDAMPPEAGEYAEYSGFIRRDDLPNNPAAIPLKRAARTLLEQGVPGDTKVALHVTNTRYQVEGGEPIMTLEELADLELAMPSWERLKSEADIRGLKVLPTGAGAEVTTAEGLKYHFHDQMEALYAITKYPINRLGVKLDSDIEKVFGMGSERLYDADVDIDSFRPAKLQELATQSLFTGQRPAISVWSRNAFKVEAAIRVMEKNAGLKEGTFKVLTVSADESKRKMTLIYEPNRVRQTLLPFQQSGFLKNMLGVDWNVSDELLLQQLADIPHGLDVLYGREPFSAMFYAYLRKKGLKEEWKRGVLQNDELGPYRTFPREVAGPSTVGVRGGAPDIPDATGDDLGDLVGLPDGMGRALSGEIKPTVPDIEPEKLAEFEEYMRRLDRGEGTIKDTGGGIFSKLYSYFAVPLKHWQKRQAETGVPFFDWYESISFARQDVEVMLNDTIHQTRLIEKTYDRKTRELAQQLFEAKMAGVDYDRFYSRVEEPVRKAAEDIEASLRSFFIDKMSWDEKMFRQFWGTEVSNIRKADGDASYYFRRHLPGPSRTIFKQLESGEVMFDQREFDPAKIIKRVTRAFANEQHLVPVVNKVRKQIVPFVQAGRIPAGDGAMFEKYLNEAVHMPDYLQMQLSYGIKKTVDAIVKRFPGAKRVLTEAESVDVMGAFSSFNVLANMGFQPGMIMRNFIGGAQMIYSTAGSADAATRALSWAAKAMRNPKAKKWLEDRGVIMRDPVAQSVANIADATRTLAGGRALGAIGTGYTKVLETGMSAYKTTDDFTRVWAYKTQYDISKSLGKKLAEKKITIDEYVEQGKIDMLGPIVERNTRTMLLQGKYEEAAHYTALYYKDMTQFRYGRGDVPYVLQGTVGRLFGQYGTWPLNYIQFLKDSVMGPGSRKNRLGVVAKWAAVQGATFLTMQEVFGVDFTRWSFFAPMGYRGGPFLELADQASSVLKAKVAGDDDVVAKLQAQRLKDHAYKQITPVPWGALRTLDKTMEEMQSGDWPSTLRALLGLPEATP